MSEVSVPFMTQRLQKVLEAFESRPDLCGLSPLSGGLINDTYRVSGAQAEWVLQRINSDVFHDPVAVMRNLRVLVDHAGSVLAAGDLRLPTIHPTRSGNDFHVDDEGVLWRGLSLIPHARTLGRVPSQGEALEIGRALGWFHRLTENLPPQSLVDPLPGFHVAPEYLSRWDTVLSSGLDCINAAVERCVAFVDARRDQMAVLEWARATGHLKERVIHGDPKLDNVLFSVSNGLALSLIDLDTVKPGLIQYDLGDCFRSSCNVSEKSGAIRFDASMFEAVLEGYLREAGDALTAVDVEYIYPATWLLPLELGLRFLMDHCLGDRYFKVQSPGENLLRAQRQFDLVLSIELQRDLLESIVVRQAMRCRGPR
jgi:thiamine kinase-like enzyme